MGSRAEGFDGEIVLLSDEPGRPYERPPLATGYLQGKDERESVFVHPADWYNKNNVELRLDTPATAIHPAIHTVAFIAFWLHERRPVAGMNATCGTSPPPSSPSSVPASP